MMRQTHNKRNHCPLICWFGENSENLDCRDEASSCCVCGYASDESFDTELKEIALKATQRLTFLVERKLINATRTVLREWRCAAS